MPQNNKPRKPAVPRAVTVEVQKARVEPFELRESKSGVKYISFKAFAPSALDGSDSTEVKLSCVAFAQNAELVAQTKGRLNLKGYLQAKEWENKQGETVVSNEFVVTSAESVVAKSAQPAQRQAVQEEKEEVNDDIPF